MASLTGQAALRKLPPKSFSSKRTVATYQLPSELRAERKSLTSSSNRGGIDVQKVAKSGKLQSRRVAFSIDNRTIYVTTNRIRSFKGLIKYVNPSNRGRDVAAKGIDISQIQCIQRGQLTNRFLMARALSIASNGGTGGGFGEAEAPNCLSIVYRVPTDQALQDTSMIVPSLPSLGNKQNNYQQNNANTAVLPHRFDTLDLYIPNETEYELLLTALEDLLQIYQTEIRTYDTNLLLMQFHWIDLEKEITDKLAEKEFLIICDRLNVPFQKSHLSQYFKEFCHEQQQQQHQQSASTALDESMDSSLRDVSNHHHRDNNKDSDAMMLELHQVGDLLEEIKEAALQDFAVDPLEELWLSITETDPVPPVKIKNASSLLSTNTATATTVSGTTSLRHPRTQLSTKQMQLLPQQPLELAINQNEESISAVAFLSFVRSNQKEYQTTLEDVLGLLKMLNSQTRVCETFDHDDSASALGGAAEERMTRSRFCMYMTSDHNDIVGPQHHDIGAAGGAGAGGAFGLGNDRPLAVDDDEQDMSQPISNYWINSSHDTYLAKVPNSFTGGGSSSSAQGDKSNNPPQQQQQQRTAINPMTVDSQMYWAALNRGCRAIDVDVWDGIYGEPVVARREPITNQVSVVPFLDVLRILKGFLNVKPDSYPIILCLENHCTVPRQDIMAKDLVEILGDSLYRAKVAQDDKELPSPEALRGKVVLKSKRPKEIRKGAIVMNDDFDEDNDVVILNNSKDGEESDADLRDRHDDGEEGDDDDLDEEEQRLTKGHVIGFEAAGPIRSLVVDESSPRREPHELYGIAKKEADIAHKEVVAAETRVAELRSEANRAREYVGQLAVQAGLSPSEMKRLALRDKQNAHLIEDGAAEVDFPSFHKNLEDQLAAEAVAAIREKDRPTDAKTKEEDEKSIATKPSIGEQGLEVQDFFGETVRDTKTKYSDADEEFVRASAKAADARGDFEQAERDVETAEVDLQASYRNEVELKEASEAAAAETRLNLEHAETARQRVHTVRELLQTSMSSSASAETVVVTAVTEAKISEQRATETEKRAARALAAAEKERSRADSETKKEEVLENEAARLHEMCSQEARRARSARERMEKAATMLDRLNEQIKLIERSSQFQKEMREWKEGGEVDPADTPRLSNNSIVKHRTKVEERDKCSQTIRESTVESTEADSQRKRSQVKFEEAARAWKTQAEVASAARKQADRSSQHAEELAEHAEEEREAATLRHIAREKAQRSVKERVMNRTSVEAQLTEAERASVEAASLALETRKRAERLASEYALSKDHSLYLRNVEAKRQLRDVAKERYDEALGEKDKATAKVSEAKRLYDTSSEVYTNARSTAAAEIHAANLKRQSQRNAVVAYSKALLTTRQCDQAEALLKLARETEAAKSAAARHALDYKTKMEQTAPVSPALARLVTLNSTKFRHWEKSLSLPHTAMHSLSKNHVEVMLNKREKETRSNFVKYTQDRICRVFPSWKTGKSSDPTIQHSLGCQLVSVNLQSIDESVLVNDGRFRANDSCGYVLKPSNLPLVPSSSGRGGSVSRERSQRWVMSVLGARNLPNPESVLHKRNVAISPYVVVSLYEGDTDQNAVVVHTTKAVPNNGLNPTWGKVADAFDVVVRRPSLAIMLMTVWDAASNDFIAASSFPVSCIREGYRSVALFDSMHSKCGPYAFASLFVKVQKLSK